MNSDPEGSAWLDAARLQATLRETRALRQLARETIARAQATRAQARAGRSRREILRESAFARLAARQETMPVIEQAKGIIMAQQRCGPEEAFDLLRQTSQRTNIKAHVLAAPIAEHIASSENGDNVTAITLGASRCHRPGNGHDRPPGDTGQTPRLGP